MKFYKRMIPVLGAAVIATLFYILSLLFKEPTSTVIIGLGGLVFLTAFIYTLFSESIQTVKDFKDIYRKAKGKHDE